MKKFVLSIGLLTTLIACGPASVGGGGFMRDVPEDVVAIAAPNQNLNSVKLKEEDNCFWYEHVGPVETTLLPLRSKRGQHICMRPASEETS
ncbi:MAG: hypothetical protein AAGA06_03945 [Pseudomonadota bacterium]